MPSPTVQLAAVLATNAVKRQGELRAENNKLREAINHSNEVFAMALASGQSAEVAEAMNAQCAANRKLVPLTA